MRDRVPSAIALVSSFVIIGYACATTPTTNTNPQPTAGAGASAQAQGGAAGRGALRGPMTDSARRVRDSLNAARPASGPGKGLRSIARPAKQTPQSGFKNNQILQSGPA